MQTADAGPELRDYADVLRRRWVAVAAGAAGGLLVAVAAVLALPSEYASTTAVQVRPTGPAELTGERSGRTNGEVNLDTEAQVVRSTKVAAAAGELIGATETPDELRERVEITVPPNSSVLEIAYRGDSPRRPGTVRPRSPTPTWTTGATGRARRSTPGWTRCAARPRSAPPNWRSSPAAGGRPPPATGRTPPARRPCRSRSPTSTGRSPRSARCAPRSPPAG
ncbi:Wzz/FepE/Etk N-terminal domain-containing protein [Nocardiopsis composta]